MADRPLESPWSNLSGSRGQCKSRWPGPGPRLSHLERNQAGISLTLSTRQGFLAWRACKHCRIFRAFCIFLNYFIYFQPYRVLIAAARAFSSGRATLPCHAWASHCSGFSYHKAWAPGQGLSSCGTQAQVSCGTWGSSWTGSNPCPLHWQAGSYSLDRQGSLDLFK